MAYLCAESLRFRAELDAAADICPNDSENLDAAPCKKGAFSPASMSCSCAYSFHSIRTLASSPFSSDAPAKKRCSVSIAANAPRLRYVGRDADLSFGVSQERFEDVCELQATGSGDAPHHSEIFVCNQWKRMLGGLRNERSEAKIGDCYARVEVAFQDAVEWPRRRMEERHGMACRKSVLPKFKGTTRNKARQATSPVGGW